MQHDLVSSPQASSLALITARAPAPHSITVRGWRACSSTLRSRYDALPCVCYQGKGGTRRKKRGWVVAWMAPWWAFLGGPLRPPYDVPAILALVGDRRPHSDA